MTPSIQAIEASAIRLLPVTTHDTPDYAEVTFGDTQSQTMTMEPDVFLTLNALPELLAAARERDALTARIAALEGALEPFAEAAKLYGEETRGDLPLSAPVLFLKTEITVGDLRKARALQTMGAGDV